MNLQCTILISNVSEVLAKQILREIFVTALVQTIDYFPLSSSTEHPGIHRTRQKCLNMGHNLIQSFNELLCVQRSSSVGDRLLLLKKAPQSRCTQEHCSSQPHLPSEADRANQFEKITYYTLKINSSL